MSKKKKHAKGKRPVAKKSKMPKWLQNIVKKCSENRGLSAVIAALAVVLVVAIVVAVVIKVDKKYGKKGPGVQISEEFYHETPKGFEVENAVQFVDSDAKDYLCDGTGYSLTTQPVAHENGWMVFDSDGWARRYRDEEGELHDLPKDEWQEMIYQPAPLPLLGGVETSVVVYKDAEVDKVEAVYLYFIVSDASDLTCLFEVLKGQGYTEVSQAADTVVEITMNSDDITQLMETNGMENTMANYQRYLEQVMGVTKK